MANLHRGEAQPALNVAGAAVDLDKQQSSEADHKQACCHQTPVSLQYWVTY